MIGRQPSFSNTSVNCQPPFVVAPFYINKYNICSSQNVSTKFNIPTTIKPETHSASNGGSVTLKHTGDCVSAPDWSYEDITPTLCQYVRSCMCPTEGLIWPIIHGTPISTLHSLESSRRAQSVYLVSRVVKTFRFDSLVLST